MLSFLPGHAINVCRAFFWPRLPEIDFWEMRFKQKQATTLDARRP